MPKKIKRKPSGKVMIVVVHGAHHMLTTDVDEAMTEHIEFGDSIDDVEIPHDGVWTCSMAWVDGGAGDLPGTREYNLAATAEHVVTEAEWSAFIAGEWPWAVGS